MDLRRIYDKGKQQPNKQFESLNATQLYCRNCKQAMPVREKLLLVLRSGDIHHYVCTGCGATLGKKT